MGAPQSAYASLVTGRLSVGDETQATAEPPERRVLDKGFVRLIDSMGDDARIVQAARVSYGKGTTTPDKDEALIDFLLRHRHTSPFEKVRFEFHVKVPIFIARQWMRHRTGSFNEVSARYTEMADDFYMPEVWRQQTRHNKQVTDGEIDDPMLADSIYEESLELAYQTYQELMEEGVGREQARMALPVSLYTEFYWTVDAHNLLHFLQLRLHTHAQKEIRAYGEAILELITPIIPTTVASWKNHVLNAAHFSGDELDILLGALPQDVLEDVMDVAEKVLKPSRRREFYGKLRL